MHLRSYQHTPLVRFRNPVSATGHLRSRARTGPPSDGADSTPVVPLPAMAPQLPFDLFL